MTNNVLPVQFVLLMDEGSRDYLVPNLRRPEHPDLRYYIQREHISSERGDDNVHFVIMISIPEMWSGYELCTIDSDSPLQFETIKKAVNYLRRNIDWLTTCPLVFAKRYGRLLTSEFEPWHQWEEGWCETYIECRRIGRLIDAERPFTDDNEEKLTQLARELDEAEAWCWSQDYVGDSCHFNTSHDGEGWINSLTDGNLPIGTRGKVLHYKTYDDALDFLSQWSRSIYSLRIEDRHDSLNIDFELLDSEPRM